MKPKRKTILAVSIAILVIALSLIAVFSENRAGTSADGKLARVACLGDSITENTGYPADLQMLLGSNSIVGNFGVSGATVNFYTDVSYYFEPAFQDAKIFEPTIVIIMLGTNDARTDTYQKINNFVADYERIINSIQALNSKPQIFLVEPPPIFNNTLNLNGTSFAKGVIPRIEQVASTLGLPIINVYTPLINHPEYFPDGVHPNSEGAQIIANIIYKAINSDST
ncbi:MAG: GDSL-type esterase/lipase family protein [Candidatus Bathyarchaeia archaeon]|jgi:lysophospholipase L1-like esterase